LDYLNQYLDFLHFERGLSDNTRNNYARDIEQLIQLSQPADLASLQITQIRKYVAMLHGKGLGGKSIARMLSSWRGFFDYLVQRHQFKHNPVIGMRAPKSPKTLPQALSIEQASKLVDIQDDDILSQRDHAILELFYSSGLRLSELVGLNIDHIDFAEGTVIVTGKGNKTRIVPLGAHAASAIQTWLPVRARMLMRNPSEKAVFISKQGRRIHICFAIVLPHMCCNPVETYAQSKKC
jgi:integrase/recombinase XerC